MNGFCPICEKETELNRFSKTEELNIKGELITIERDLFRCSSCGGEFDNPDPTYDPLELAYEEYRNRKGMIHPAQIVEFRKKYNLTQKDLNVLLGLGGITLSRYENGSLQDEAHDQLLHFIMEPLNLLHRLEEKPDLLSQKNRDLLISSLKKEILLKSCFPRFNENESSIYTGNKKLDLQKVINVIKFLAHNSEVFKTKLLKELFYVDFKYFKEFKTSVTGLQYAHLPYGPVPNDFNLLIGTILEADPTIHMEERIIANYEGDVVVSSEPYDPSCFTQAEVEVLRNIYSFFLGFSAKEIKEYSHKEKAYTSTLNSHLISYEFAKDLSI